MKVPTKNDMYRHRLTAPLINVAAVIGVALAVITLLGFTVWGWDKSACQVCYAVWALLPPSFFAVEMAWLYNWEYEKFDEFKHLHDLSRAFWGAVLVVLAVAYFGRFGLQVPGGLTGG